MRSLRNSCHHAPDGRELRSHADFIESLTNGRKDLRICAGWKAAVAENVRRGLFARGRTVRRALGEYAVDQLNIFVSRDVEAEDKEDARLELDRTLRILCKTI